MNRRVQNYGLLLIIGGIAAIFFHSTTVLIHIPYAKTIETPDSCKSLGSDKQNACFLEEIVNIAQSSGLQRATNRLKELTSRYPAFQNDCHGVMHVLGEESYGLYVENVSLNITSSITYCTYGFYHGFITEAVNQEGSFDIAREFCAYANEQLAKEGFSADEECYHGFGHAAVDDHISTQFSNAVEATDNAVVLCDSVSETFLQYQACASGVYNGVANTFVDRTFPWPEIDEENIFALCEEQETALQLACYSYFARVLFDRNDGSFKDSMLSALSIPDEVNRIGVIKNIAVTSMFYKTDKKDFSNQVSTCRLGEDAYRLQCMQGLSEGIIQSAPPTQEYEYARVLCASEMLTELERAECYKSALENMQKLVSTLKYAEACDRTPEKYQNENCAS